MTKRNDVYHCFLRNRAGSCRKNEGQLSCLGPPDWWDSNHQMVMVLGSNIFHQSKLTSPHLSVSKATRGAVTTSN
jgi:hypothetical protein